jgi:hypothetical protein
MSHLAIETVICLGFLVEQNKVSTILAVWSTKVPLISSQRFVSCSTLGN